MKHIYRPGKSYILAFCYRRESEDLEKTDVFNWWKLNGVCSFRRYLHWRGRVKAHNDMAENNKSYLFGFTIK